MEVPLLRWFSLPPGDGDAPPSAFRLGCGDVAFFLLLFLLLLLPLLLPLLCFPVDEPPRPSPGPRSRRRKISKGGIGVVVAGPKLRKVCPPWLAYKSGRRTCHVEGVRNV